MLTLKIILTFSAFIFAGFSLWRGTEGEIGVLGWGMSFSMLCLIAGFSDKFVRFKAGPTGVEAETREVINEAHNTIVELKTLALTLAKLTMSLSMRSGRMGGFNGEEIEQIKCNLDGTLKQLGLSDYDGVFVDWYKYTCYDYVSFILRPYSKQNNVPKEIYIPCQKILMDLHKGAPSAALLQEWISEWGAISSESKELLLDLEYFQKKKKFRREKVWFSMKGY